MSTKLFLASEAKHPLSLKRLRRFVGSFKGKKLLYIPTAANGEFFGSWKGGESVQAAQTLGADFQVLELESMAFQDIYAPILQADILWLAGGMSGYLLYWLRRTHLNKKLPKILAKGTLLVGGSAGAMVCAKTQYSAECYLREPEPGASLVPGLGLVDFEIYPHYEEKDLPEIKKRWHGGELYLLKNGEVITVVDGKVKVLGKKRVLVSKKE